MNRRWIVGLVAAALVLSAGPASSNTATRALTMQAEVAPASARFSGSVEVSAVLTNTDRSRDVILRGEPGWSSGGGFSIEVTDASGNRRLVKPEEGGMTLEAASTGTRRFVLTPGFAFGTSRVLQTKELFPSPGTYTIRVIYQAPKPGNGQSIGNGQLEGETAASTPVTVVVRA